MHIIMIYHFKNYDSNRIKTKEARNDLEEISQDILAINYGKLLNDGVTPESYLTGINAAIAHGGPIGPRPW